MNLDRIEGQNRINYNFYFGQSEWKLKKTCNFVSLKKILFEYTEDFRPVAITWKCFNRVHPNHHGHHIFWGHISWLLIFIFIFSLSLHKKNLGTFWFHWTPRSLCCPPYLLPSQIIHHVEKQTIYSSPVGFPNLFIVCSEQDWH